LPLRFIRYGFKAATSMVNNYAHKYRITDDVINDLAVACGTLNNRTLCQQVID